MFDVLIIEDSKTINNILSKRLEELGLQVTQTFTLKEAEERLSQKKYDFLILDLHLPDGEGIDLLGSIQTITDTKIIVLTSTADDESLRQELFNRGILDYIIKDQNFLYSVEEVIKIFEHFLSRKKKNMIIIDDSKFVVRQVKRVLDTRNYNVDGIHTGKEGLELLEKKEYELIILDIELPDLHGLEVLKRIRDKPSLIHLPIIVLSGSNTPGLVRKILKSGANDYIKKPFVAEEFILKVDFWIDYFEQQMQLKRKTIEMQRLNERLEKIVKAEVAKNVEQEKMLLAQSRLAAMGELIAIIAHQWRQPINVISTIANNVKIWLELKEYDIEKIKENCENILRQINYLDTTMEDFRNFFMPQKEMVKTDFGKIVQKAVEILEHLLYIKDIELVIEKKSVEKLETYENELLQVVINIIKNAVDAMENKNRRKIKILIDGCKLEIADSGGGVPSKILTKIFEPYFSTKGQKGTGLGLYLSKRIVEERCNGKLEVRNEKEGAIFTIELCKS